MEILRAIAIKPGRALIVVTHDNRVFKYSDRIATMQDGHIIRMVRRHVVPHDPADTVSQSAPASAGLADGTAFAPVG
jgi:ABC-type lipoprotein export system ATPase subunit